MNSIKCLTLSVTLLTAGLLAVGTFVGCSAEKPVETAKTDTVDPALKDLPPKQQEALSKLSPGDLKLALEQKTCPVTGEPLGSMGKPIKIAGKDKVVFVCCKGCIDSVK